MALTVFVMIHFLLAYIVHCVIYVNKYISNKTTTFFNMFSKILFYFSQTSYRPHHHQAHIYNLCDRFTEMRLPNPFQSSFHHCSCSSDIASSYGLGPTCHNHNLGLQPPLIKCTAKTYTEQVDDREP